MESYKISGLSHKQDERQVVVNQKKWKDIRFYLEEKKVRGIIAKDKIFRPVVLVSYCLVPVMAALIVWSLICNIVQVNSWFLKEINFVYFDAEEYYNSWVYLDYMFLVAVTACIFCIVLMLLTSSSAFRKAYNIESKATGETKYILVQDKDGKIGLFKKTWLKFVRILGFKYDNIIRCTENSYICWIGTKCGIYNTSLHKMVLPLEYDSISLTGEDIVDTVKDGFSQRFTTKGYRASE